MLVLSGKKASSAPVGPRVVRRGRERHFHNHLFAPPEGV